MKIPKQRSKYNAKKTLVDGIIFDSAAEAYRYKELKLLEKAGEICDIRLQVPYTFSLKGKKIFTYYADFVYAKYRQHALALVIPLPPELIIEDVKGMKTAIYRLKKKLIEAQHGITITEISK